MLMWSLSFAESNVRWQNLEAQITRSSYVKKTVSVEAYVRSFMWDDTKFPRNRYLADNLQTMTSTVALLDEDIKTKTFQYQDVKTSLTNMTKMKGPGTSLTSVDLVDILTPAVVTDGDFVNKEHLYTVLVIVPKQNEADFLKTYEKCDPCVVPRSAKQFKRLVNGTLGPIDDKDGNTLWRVICFKNSVDALRRGLRECKCSVREFNYDPMASKNQAAEMAKTDSELKKKEQELKRICGCAFSDCFVTWMHLKAVRCFVESVLRYGVPANFHSFLVHVPKAANQKPLKGVLADTVFKNSTLFGQSYIADAKGAEGEEEYYPYVCLPFSALQEKAA